MVEQSLYLEMTFKSAINSILIIDVVETTCMLFKHQSKIIL